MLQPSSSQHEFETPLLSNDFGQQLKIAMCMTTNTQTSLDVFTSDEIITGVLESSISDHLVTIFMFSKKPTHQRKRESNLNVKIQDINSSSLEAFRSSNAAINWDKVRQPGNPDEAYEEFLGLFRKAYSQSFPLVNVRKATKAHKTRCTLDGHSHRGCRWLWQWPRSGASSSGNNAGDDVGPFSALCSALLAPPTAGGQHLSLTLCIHRTRAVFQSRKPPRLSRTGTGHVTVTCWDDHSLLHVWLVQ